MLRCREDGPSVTALLFSMGSSHLQKSIKIRFSETKVVACQIALPCSPSGSLPPALRRQPCITLIRQSRSAGKQQKRKKKAVIGPLLERTSHQSAIEHLYMHLGASVRRSCRRPVIKANLPHIGPLLVVFESKSRGRTTMINLLFFHLQVSSFPSLLFSNLFPDRGSIQ